MLVLSRKKSESIEIGKNVRVRILEIRGGRVKLGIEAPREVSVHRAEVYEKNHSNGKPTETESGG